MDEDKCNGCGWCIEACDYGAITLHPDTRKVIVCDICNGEPECVQFCPEGALNLSGKTTDKIVTGDIGCYTLGVLPPVNAVQTCLCMGAGISQAAGMIHAGVKDKVFAVIGDSTFFHAGMPGLLNIAYNKANVCVIILDNHVVAMTGHQPTPGSGKTAMGTDAKIIRIQDVARGLGIEKVEVVDPYDVKGTTKVMREMLDYHGPSVIISERPCPLLIEKGQAREVLKECNLCGECVKGFGCPAISLTPERAEIDPTLCWGCGVCEQVCPFDAIRSTGLDEVRLGFLGHRRARSSCSKRHFLRGCIAGWFRCAKAEVHGMAQRGGSIVAYARIGDKIESPLIERGKADVILGLRFLKLQGLCLC